MILDRTRLVLSALGGAPSTPEAAAVASAVGSVPSATVADGLVDGLEDAKDDVRPAGLGGWLSGTVLAAAIAAGVTSYGLSSLFALFHPFEVPGLHLLPLGALPFGVLAHLVDRALARRRAGRVALSILGALVRRGVPAASAAKVAGFVAGVAPGRLEVLDALAGETDQAQAIVQLIREENLGVGRHTSEPALAIVMPAMMVAWVVGSFWILYFSTIAQQAVGAGL